MVVARVSMLSPTGGTSAEGALGVLPDPDDIQGLDLPLVDGPCVKHNWDQSGCSSSRNFLISARRGESFNHPATALPTQNDLAGYKDPKTGVRRYGLITEVNAASGRFTGLVMYTSSIIAKLVKGNFRLVELGILLWSIHGSVYQQSPRDN